MYNYLSVINILKRGGIIAYPTEAVFGLGCDPDNEAAVLKLLRLKQRDVTKGLILIASSWEQIQPLVATVAPQVLAKVLATWPGPYTWLLPASNQVPVWIKGEHASVALRVTAHPVAKAICEAYGKPIVSTSANLAALPPARTTNEVQQQFPSGIDLIVPGNVGPLQEPTPIRDALTGAIIR